MSFPPPTWTSLLTTWTTAPIADALILLALVAYAVGIHRARARGARWPAGRTLSAALAALCTVVAVNGWLAVYGHALFWAHMAQHLTTIMVVPILLAWAAPWRLAALAGASAAVERALGARPVRILTLPPVAMAVYTAVLVLTHLTGFQAAMLENTALHDLELVLYLVSGYLLFWPLAGGDRSPWPVPYALRFFLLAVAMGADTLVGVVLMLTGHAVAPSFAASHPMWGPGALADQQTAGAVMWVGGDAVMMLLMVVVGIEWGTSRPETQTMGRWLEGVRSRTLLGAESDLGDVDTEGVDTDDERALTAYNARLAALHGQPPKRG
jgi:putative copper resistance protein D